MGLLVTSFPMEIEPSDFYLFILFSEWQSYSWHLGMAILLEFCSLGYKLKCCVAASKRNFFRDSMGALSLILPTTSSVPATILDHQAKVMLRGQ